MPSRSPVRSRESKPPSLQETQGDSHRFSAWRLWPIECGLLAIALASLVAVPPTLTPAAPRSRREVAAPTQISLRNTRLTAYDTQSGWGTHLSMYWTNQFPVQATTDFGFDTSNNLPALGSAWTIEGWIWDASGDSEYAEGPASWGSLSGTPTSLNSALPLAGIGAGSFSASWEWPGGSAPVSDSTGSGGLYDPGTPGSDAQPVFYVLEWDGSNVYAFVNGVLDSGFPVATTGAGLPAAPAGLFNAQDWYGAHVDEFRISSVARYTSSNCANWPNCSAAVPSQPFTSDGNTALLYHFDSAIGIGWKSYSTPNDLNFVFSGNVLADASSSGNAGRVFEAWYHTSYGNETVAYFASQNANGTEFGGPDELCTICWGGSYPVNDATGELMDTYKDLAIPDRSQFPFGLTRTYRSLDANQDGPLGFGWSDNYDLSIIWDSSTPPNPTVQEDNGSTISFSAAGSGCTETFAAPTRVLASLAPDASSGCQFYVLTRRDGSKLYFSLASPWALVKQVDRNGYVTALCYGNSSCTGKDASCTTASQLCTVTDQAGRVLKFAYFSGTNHIASVTDPASRKVTYGYSGGSSGTGDLTSVVDVANNTSAFAYAQNGAPAHFETDYQDAMCYATSGCAGVVAQYNQYNQVVKQTDSLGRSTTWSYNVCIDSCDYTEITDPAGNIRMEEYVDGAVLVQSIAGYGTASAATTTYSYDPTTLGLTAMTDPNGNTWHQTFDDSNSITRGDLLSKADPLNRSTIYGQYNNFGDPQTITDAVGTTTTYTYDAHGNRTGLSVPVTWNGNTQTRTITYRYADSAHPGDMTSMVDADNNTWTYTYDAYGDLLTRADPLNNVTRYVDDIVGRADCQIEARSKLTSCPSGASSYTTLYAPNAWGDFTSVTNGVGAVTAYQYDRNRNVIQLTDPNGNITKYTYDLVNELTAETDGYGSTSARTIQTQYTPDRLVSKQYDGLTRLVADASMTASSATLNSTTANFTSADVGAAVLVSGAGASGADLTSTISSVTNSSTATLAAAASTSVTGAGASIGDLPTRYSYDALNRVAQVTDPLNRVIAETYDANGNLRSEQLYSGAPITGYCYDSANELVGTTYSNQACGQSMDVSYKYTPDGLRSSMVDSTGTTSYGYDTVNQLRTDVAAGQEVDYGYNLRGLLTSITYPATPPSNHIVTRGYDAAGRLSSIAVSTSWVSGAQPINFTYDADSNLCLTNYGNGVLGAFSFDGADRLASTSNTMVYWQPTKNPPTSCNPRVSGTILLSLAYSRNSNGDVSAENSTAYGYDALNRLSSAGSTSYTADAADRLTGFGSNTQGFDGASELANSTAGSTSYTYSYDQAGNRHLRTDQSNNVTTYSYDQLNRLTSFLPSGAGAPTYGYTYNGDGLRTSKSTNGVASSSFVWNLAEGIPSLLMDGTTSYVYGPAGLPVEQVTSGGATYFYQADQLGSTRLVTTSSGTAANTYSFTSYGAIATSSGTVANPFLFAGQYMDSESSMYYLRNRYYDPSTGQFLTRDPVAAVTRQPYSYTIDNPLNHTDPTGLDYSFTTGGHINDNLTIEEILNDPAVLQGMNPAQLMEALGGAPPGFSVGPGQSQSLGAGCGWKLFGRDISIRWSPGSARADHPSSPYWRVAQQSGTSDPIEGGAWPDGPAPYVNQPPSDSGSDPCLVVYNPTAAIGCGGDLGSDPFGGDESIPEEPIPIE